MGFLNNMGKLVNGTGLTGGKINFDKMLEGAAGLVVDGAKATAKGVKAGAEAAKERKARKEAEQQMVEDDMLAIQRLQAQKNAGAVGFCSQCGTGYVEGARFCSSCGSPV